MTVEGVIRGSNYKMKIQEAMAILLLCLFVMLVKANGLQCHKCFSEKRTTTEDNCARRYTVQTCKETETYCTTSLRLTKANEVFSTLKDCAQSCINGFATEPPSSGYLGRRMSCCTENLCNAEKNVNTTATTNTTQSVSPSDSTSLRHTRSLLMFVILMPWSWNLYGWIM